MKTVVFILFGLLLLSSFSMVGFAEEGKVTYSYFSLQDAYLAGTAAYNNDFLIAGSNHLYVYENDSILTKFTTDKKIITDIQTDGKYLYLCLVNVTPYSSGNHHGPPQPNPNITYSPNTVTSEGGYNITNLTLLKFDKQYNVKAKYTLNNVTIYSSSQQLFQAAQILLSNSIYIVLTGQYANNTERDITEIYKLQNSEFTKVYESNTYTKKVIFGDSHYYMLEWNSSIEEYDLNFYKVGDSASLQSQISDYEDIIYKNHKLHIIGNTLTSSYRTIGKYDIVDPSFSIVYGFSINASSELKRAVITDNTTFFVDAQNRLYTMESDNIHTLRYLTYSNTKYMYSITNKEYYNLEQNSFVPTYIAAYIDNASQYHYVWGGYYLTWDKHIHMYFTLSDKPVNWQDIRSIAGMMYIFETPEYFVAIITLFVIITSGAIIKSTTKKRRRSR